MEGDFFFAVLVVGITGIVLVCIGGFVYGLGGDNACNELRLRVGAEVHQQAVKAEICR